ncbi:hypothetical protein Tco_0071679 [Tanacetum coccineum]
MIASGHSTRYPRYGNATTPVGFSLLIMHVDGLLKEIMNGMSASRLYAKRDRENLLVVVREVEAECSAVEMEEDRKTHRDGGLCFKIGKAVLVEGRSNYGNDVCHMYSSPSLKRIIALKHQQVSNCGFADRYDPPMCERAVQIIHGLLRSMND